MRKQQASTEEKAEQAPTLAGDIDVLKGLEPAAICTWLRTKYAPPGMRTPKFETLQEYLRLSPEQTQAMDRVMDFCAGLIARYERTAVSTVAELVQGGLDIDRSTFVVDAAAANAEYTRQLGILGGTLRAPDIGLRQERLESATHKVPGERKEEGDN